MTLSFLSSNKMALIYNDSIPLKFQKLWYKKNYIIKFIIKITISIHINFY